MSRTNWLWSPSGMLLSGVPGLKRQRHEADHSSPPSAEFASSYPFVVRTGKDSFRSPWKWQVRRTKIKTNICIILQISWLCSEYMYLYVLTCITSVTVRRSQNSVPFRLFLFHLDTLIFSFFFTFTVFLYMFRTDRSIIRRIKCLTLKTLN